MKKAVAALALITLVSLGYAAWKSIGPPASVAYRQPIFEPQHMAEAFRTMGELFPSRTVSRSANGAPLPSALRNLDAVSFEVDGQSYQFADLLEANNTQGLIVLHKGNIVYENYLGEADAASRFTSWSMAKSFTSTLVGLAIGEGLIDSVDDQLVTYIEELQGTAYDGVSIAQALQMSSGVAFTEVYAGDVEADITYFMGYSLFANMKPANQLAAAYPRAHPPGTKFNYNTAETQILAWLVANVTGMHPAQYLQQKIWQPLGMSHDANWLLDQYGGMEMGGCCLEAALRDYARFGQLFLQDGMWQGQQLLPAGWVEKATTPDAPHLNFTEESEGETGYQYQWWRLGEQAFSAEGVHGQFIYVNPEAEVVIAKVSSWDEAWSKQMAGPAMAGFHAIAAYLQNHNQAPTESPGSEVVAH